MTPRFHLLGDVMVDITAIVDEPINYASDTPARVSLQAGGAAANSACWLAHDGHDAALIGAVGDDAFGSLVRNHLAALQVTDLLVTMPGSVTGTCVVIVDASGERTMLPDPGANAGLTPRDLPGAAFRSGDHLHLSGYTLLHADTRAAGMAALQRARDAGMTTSLDPASAAPLAQNPRVLDPAMTLIDVLIANEAEAEVLTGFADPRLALAALTDLVATAVVKLGSEGSIALRTGARRTGARRTRALDDSPSHGAHAPAGESASTRAVDAEIVDTTGAGDAFAAGFLPAWVAGLRLHDCLNAGSRSAARAVARVGAGPGAVPPGE
jgi:sugar/nucleoside kinase (ribokinase family)